jgi:hypothetical protein
MLQILVSTSTSYNTGLLSIMTFQSLRSKEASGAVGTVRMVFDHQGKVEHAFGGEVKRRELVGDHGLYDHGDAPSR